MKNSGSFKAVTFLSLFGLAITVPLVLLFGALLLQSSSVQREQLEARLVQEANGLVSDLDREFDRDITILHTLSTSDALASADWRTFYGQAKAGLQGRAYLVLTDSNGRQLVNTYVPYGEQPATTGDPETIRRISQTKAPVVSNLFDSLVVKRPVFNVSLPILQNGQLRYVVSLGLLPDDLVALLKSQKLGSEWVTMIWDANGVILARSRDNQQYVGKPLPRDMREHDQRTVVRTANLDGTDVFHATARSLISGWGVGVNVPYSMVSEQLRHSLLIWLAGAVLAITIALVAGVFFAGQITTSLSAASHAAAAFGRGELVPHTGSRLREADEFLATLKNAQAAREKLMQAVKHSRDWLQTTLASIGDAVIATDHQGRITFLNGVSQNLTGWTQEEAAGKLLEEVFVIRNADTGLEVENPVAKVLREGRTVGLANHTRLLAKDGRRIPIDDSAAPIYENGKIAGVVLVFRDITERLKAEERMILAVDAAPNAMIMVGRDGAIALINSQTEKLFGYQRSELLGQPVDILLPERYRSGHEAFRASFFREPVARPMGAGRDLFGLRKDGSEVPIEIGLSPTSTSSGDFVLAGIIDISERKQAEAAVGAALARAQKGELLLNAIMDFVPEGITYAEAPDVTIRMVSRYGLELINKPRELIEGIAAGEHAEKWDLYHLDGAPARDEELPLTRAVRNGEVAIDEEWMIRTSAGSEISLLCNAGPIRDLNGKILGGIIAWRDITRRKAAEAALQHSEQRLATVMKHLPVGVGLIDTEGHVVIANAAWKKLVPGDIPSIDSLEGSRWRATAANGRPLSFDKYPGQRALRGEEVLPGIDFLRQVDGGTERWTRVGAVPLRDETGRITGALAMLQDIDQERRAETQRAELLAKERALEAEQALRETEAELARVARALSLGELATSIAHEVNQPLAAVVTNAEAGLRWLRSGPPNIDEAKESLSMIAEDGERAAEVIRRLREFLKKRAPERAPLDINEVIREAIALARSELLKRQLEIRMELSGDLLPVLGDRIQLQQVILNLLMNGAEAITAAAASKRLTVSSRMSDDGRLIVAVRDSGGGIGAEEMPRIFDPFFTTKPTGMGMGLSISRSILEAHGGRIWAEANQDSGLTLQFSLPVHPAEGRSTVAAE